MNNKHHNSVKDEFFVKLQEYLACIVKMVKMEENTGLDFDKAFDVLFDTNIEYQKLCDKSSSLKADIDRLLISFKGHPLTITSKEIKFLDLFSDHLESNIDEDALNKYFEVEMLTQEENIAKRLKDVKILYLPSILHHRIFSLYGEAINCYIQGSFNATCVLCRAISELIAKQYIDHRGDGHLLCGENSDKKILTIPGLLINFSVSTHLIEKYRKIHSKADHILHDVKDKKGQNVSATQENALEILKLLREFIKEFPTCL